MKFVLVVLLSSFLFLSINAAAQKNRIKCKYGDVKPEDFAATVYAIDSFANAVYLFDGGNADFEGNNKGLFSIIYQKHAKIRLLNKNAFGEATVEIPLYVSTWFEQKLEDIDAATYNIEDGKVVVTKLDKTSMFKDKHGSINVMKFTFPNIKEGSIIEYSYKISTPSYRYLQGWQFQGEYPRLWSEYEITIPQFYDYVAIRQGYNDYVIDTVKISHANYNITDPGDGFERTSHISASANTINSIMAMKDVPALKKENFTTTIDNYISKIEFQLSAVRYPNQEPKMIMRNWPALCEDLMKDEDYGEALTHGNGWLNDDVKKTTAGTKTDLEKAEKIFEFVRDNYSCTDKDALYLSQTLKKVFQAKKGNVVDVNMLLTAMLQNAGFETHPVMLSTRDNGKAYEMYPVITKFNYTICQLILGDKQYLLDASDNKIGFNHLSNECYNGYARIIDKDKPYVIDLSADSLKESKFTSVFIVNGEKGNFESSVTSTPGYIGSLELRGKLASINTEDFFKDLKKGYSFDVDIENGKIDSLKILGDPVTIKYDLNFNLNDEDLVYFNPMLGEKQNQNPFTSLERLYPVEMSACKDETYVLNMDVPTGYTVDELPKSVRVKFNEDEGMFEYMIAQSGDHIQLRTRVLLKKANFEPEDYQTLRDFFGYIVKKQSEQIVFKKIN